jgi:hypothetical protein
VFWRPVQDADLRTCLDIEPRHLGHELVGCERALAAWHWLLRSPAFNSAIIEADPPFEGHRTLAFGAAVFVSSAFVDAELENPRPGINARIIASISEGKPVVLDEQQLRNGNAYDGLDIVCLVGAYRPGISQDLAIEVLTTLASSFVEAHSGYRNRRILGEAIGNLEVSHFIAAGVWRRVKSFDDLPETGEVRWGKSRALFVMTRKEAYAVPISNTIHLFQYRRPLLGLRESDQRFLQVAFAGLTDEELAARLNVHVGSVKKHWLDIYDRMIKALPELFSDCLGSGDARTRGKQKRHRVLAYVRDHPEELRPFEYSRETRRNPLHRGGIADDALVD